MQCTLYSHFLTCLTSMINKNDLHSIMNAMYSILAFFNMLNKNDLHNIMTTVYSF